MATTMITPVAPWNRLKAEPVLVDSEKSSRQNTCTGPDASRSTAHHLVSWSATTTAATTPTATANLAGPEGGVPWWPSSVTTAALIGQRRDRPPLLQATHSRAKGSAWRRALGIGWKQRSQPP